MIALENENIKNQYNLRQEFERQFKEVKEKYALKMEKLRQEMEELRATLIK